MLGYQQPSFTLARLCFAASSAILFLAIAATAACIDAQIAVRVVVATLGAGVGGLFLIVGLLWTSLRQIDFDRHQQQPPATVTPQSVTPDTTSTTATSSPQPVPPSATHTAVDTIAPPETFRPGSGTRDDPFTNADVLKITEAYDSRTALEANVVTKRYIGQWMKIDAKVYNVSPGSVLNPNDVSVDLYLDVGDHHAMIFSHFTDAKEQAVKVLRRDDKVIVAGKIGDIGYHRITLERCALISP
ncbi:MAG TPA: hypothetical protein VF713_24665 [Thermoanaerobaculia bacterium]